MSTALISRRSVSAIAAACLLSVALPAGTAWAQKVKTKPKPSEAEVSFSVSIPEVDAVDSSIDEAVIADILRGNLIENADALATLDATSISVPEITITVTSDRDGETTSATLTFTELLFEDVVDGVAANVSLANSAMHSDEGHADFGIMSAEGFNIGAMLGIYGLVEATGTGEMETIYSNFVMEGGMLAADDVSCTFGAAQAAEFKGRPLNTSFVEIMTLAQQLEDEPDNPDPALIGKVMRMYADIFTAFETSEATFDGFQCEGTDSDDRPMKFSVAGMTMDGMRPGFYPAISIDGLDITVEGDGFMRLENLTFKQMDLASTIETLTNAPELVTEDWLEANARKLIPAFEGFSFSGFSMDIPDSDNEADRIKAQVGAFDLTLANYLNGIPSSIDTSAANIFATLPEDSDDEQLQMLIDLGVTQLDAGFRLAAAWNADTDSIAIEEVSVTGADLATIVLAGSIANVGESLFSLDENEALMAAMGAAVKSLDLTVTDMGLSDIVLALAAAEQGGDPAAMRPIFAGLAEGTIIGMLAGAADAAKLGSAVNSFVSGTAKTLNITLDAKEEPGLGMADFMAAEDNPALLLDKVNIGATAK